MHVNPQRVTTAWLGRRKEPKKKELALFSFSLSQPWKIFVLHTTLHYISILCLFSLSPSLPSFALLLLCKYNIFYYKYASSFFLFFMYECTSTSADSHRYYFFLFSTIRSLMKKFYRSRINGIILE